MTLRDPRHAPYCLPYRQVIESTTHKGYARRSRCGDGHYDDHRPNDRSHEHEIGDNNRMAHARQRYRSGAEIKDRHANPLDLLLDMDPGDVMAIARFFEQVSRALAAYTTPVAVEVEHYADDPVRQRELAERLALLSRLPDEIRERLRAGDRLDAIAAHYEAQNGLATSAFFDVWKSATRSALRRARMQRNRLIVDLAQKGVSNAEIARRVERENPDARELWLAPASVSKIIADAYGGKKRPGRRKPGERRSPRSTDD